MDNDFAEAMESISCGTPMLAANAQGFAMYLTHGVNATQMQRGFCNVGLGSERAPCSTPSLNLGQAFHTWQCGVIRL